MSQRSNPPAHVCSAEASTPSTETASLPGGRRVKWEIFGRPLCSRAFRMLLGVSRNLVDRLVCGVRAGRTTPPEDQRRFNRRQGSSWLHVDAFLHYMWEFVAEPLADAGRPRRGVDSDTEAGKSESDVEVDTEPSDAGETDGSDVEEPAVLDSVVSRICSSISEPDGPTKWLGPQSRAELYDCYVGWHRAHLAGLPASQATFRRVWLGPWKHVLKIRQASQHARCARCAELGQQRLVAETMEEKTCVADALQAHHQLVFADRTTDSRASALSTASCRPGSAINGRLLKIDLDGCDQAKFRCPRNLASSKRFEALWRPQLHFTGIIMHGLAELYLISDPDVPCPAPQGPSWNSQEHPSREGSDLHRHLPQVCLAGASAAARGPLTPARFRRTPTLSAPCSPGPWTWRPRSCVPGGSGCRSIWSSTPLGLLPFPSVAQLCITAVPRKPRCIAPQLPPRMHGVRARRLSRQSHRSRRKADNTPREHKNAGLLLFSGWLVATGRFASCSNSFFEVGHTHNVVDQRFSSVTRLLRRCQSLQTPGAFAAEIQQKLQPTCNREVVVEQLPGAHAWHEFFDHLGVGVSGLTSTAVQPHANHCWRVVRRADLHVFRKSSGADWEVEVPEAHASLPQCLVAPGRTRLQHGVCLGKLTPRVRPSRSELPTSPEARHASPGRGPPQVYKDLHAAPGDAVLLLKERISSSRLAQRPLLLFPVQLLHLLPAGGPAAAPRNAMSQRELHEYRRTAAAVEAWPWSLEAAATYLRGLTDNNEQRLWQPPPTLGAVLNLSRDVVPLPPPSNWAGFAPEPTRLVVVGKAPPGAKARGRRRAPAAAAVPVAAVPPLPGRSLGQGRPKAEGLHKAKGPPKAFGKARPPNPKAAGAAGGLPKPSPAMPAPGPPPMGRAKAPPKAGAPPKAAPPKRHAPWPDTGLGCSRCRWGRNGCSQCRARKARLEAQAEVAPEADG